jgi:DNA polymerase-3 subunit delta'
MPRVRLSEIIVGQERATAALERAAGAGRLFPSLLFHGPPGVGKLATALALARALLCSAGARPCGACPACRRVDESALVHPDVMVVLPETKKMFEEGVPVREGAAGIDVQDRQAEALENAAWAVLIDRVRAAIAFVQRLPAEGPRSILIVDQAHRMEAPAANALLKVLEEPPPHAVLILTASSLHALLPTIRSRCQAVAFRPVAQDAVTTFLVERRGLPAEEAVLRAGLSGGRIGAALDLDLEEYRERRQAVLKVLEDLLLRGDPGIAVARAESVAKGAAAEPALDILMTLLRDLLVLEASGGGAPGVRLVHVDLAERLAPLARALGRRGPEAVEGLEAVLEGLRHRGNRQLLVENFFLRLTPPAPRAAARRA